MKKKFSDIRVLDMAATGKAIGKIDNQIVFIEKAIPGDLVDIEVFRKKKSFLEARVLEYKERSSAIVDPKCAYFGLCGGCKWQNISYDEQLKYKQQQVVDNLTRIGKVELSEILPILPSNNIYAYRNKLEYTFSNKRWLTREEIDGGNELFQNGVGFHIPGQFDKVLDIQKCHLQDDITNTIRNWVREYAINENLTFYDLRKHHGFLRNLIVRNTSTGDLMVILQVAEDRPDAIDKLLTGLVEAIPEISSCYYILNQKKNDSFADLDPVHFYGNTSMIEEMELPGKKGSVKFSIGPKSFFQTNTYQAVALYKLTYEFANIQEHELVYDLYTGTGTIANYIASSSKKVVGVEYIEEAVHDAKINANLNGCENLEFYSGDMKDLLTKNFFEKHGKPDVIITDPPRAGMHQDVCKRILEAAPSRIVYVSCNPATQARDIEMLSEKYKVAKVQPVDMFPHTPHVENVALLIRKNA